MTDRYHRMMRNAAYLLFAWTVVIFALSMIFAVSNAVQGGGLTTLFPHTIQAFQSAGFPFFGAAILYRLDLWLERKQ